LGIPRFNCCVCGSFVRSCFVRYAVTVPHICAGAVTVWLWHYSLPCNDFVHDFLLFKRGAAQINPRGFYAFVAHEVGKQSDVGEFLQKVFCVAVAEGVGIYHVPVNAVFIGKEFKSVGNSARGNALA